MRKLLALFVVLLALPMAFAAPSYITPGSPGAVTEQAQITGGGSPPIIKYVWVLPDENPIKAGTQVIPKLSGERNDIYACIVATDPQGRDDIQNIYVDVYHPVGTENILPCVTSAGNKCDTSGVGKPYDRNPADGLFKYQVHANRLDPTNDRAAIEDCKTKAKAAGLITQAQFDEINYNIFDQPNWYMYIVYLPMLYHQPAGIYTAKAWGTDTRSEVSASLTNVFEWVSTVALEIDFSAGITYGTIQPSVYKVVQGDYDMATLSAPTVKNEGNERIKMTVSSTTLKGAAFGKEIDDFDVKWDPQEKSYGYGQRLFDAGDVVDLSITGASDPTPLELCQTEKIDFSVHADVGLPADIYTGILTLTAAAYP